MTNITIKDLAQKVNISEGTVRSWITKPEQGKMYSAGDVNYTNLREKLHKYYPREEEFEKLTDCKIDELVIVKTERVAKTWLSVDELIVGQRVILHNYSLQTKLMYVGVFEDLVYIFQTCDNKKTYKAYHKNDFDRENIKLEFTIE